MFRFQKWMTIDLIIHYWLIIVHYENIIQKWISYTLSIHPIMDDTNHPKTDDFSAEIIQKWMVFSLYCLHMYIVQKAQNHLYIFG